MEKQTYVLKWDKLAVGITIFCTLVAIDVIALGCLSQGWQRWISILVGLFITIPSALMCPLSVTKEGDTLSVKHLLHKKHILLSEYKATTLPNGFSLNGFWRLCASGGMMGYWGLWSDGRGHRYSSFLTHRKRDVQQLEPLLPHKKRRILLNCPAEWLTASTPKEQKKEAEYDEI